MTTEQPNWDKLLGHYEYEYSSSQERHSLRHGESQVSIINAQLLTSQDLDYLKYIPEELFKSLQKYFYECHDNYQNRVLAEYDSEQNKALTKLYDLGVLSE